MLIQGSQSYICYKVITWSFLYITILPLADLFLITMKWYKIWVKRNDLEWKNININNISNDVLCGPLNDWITSISIRTCCWIQVPRSVYPVCSSLCFVAVRALCEWCVSLLVKSLQWRHNGHDGLSNHQPRDCLLKRLFRRRSKKTSKLRVTGLYAGNSPVTGEFPAQRGQSRGKCSHLMTSPCQFKCVRFGRLEIWQASQKPRRKFQTIGALQHRITRVRNITRSHDTTSYQWSKLSFRLSSGSTHAYRQCVATTNSLWHQWISERRYLLKR